MGCTQLFRQFQTVFVHIANNDGGGTIQLGGQQGGHTDRTCACDEDGVAGFDIAVLHADFVGGRQSVAQQQRDFFINVVGQRNKAVVGIRCADVFGLCAVDHVAQNPAAVAAV